MATFITIVILLFLWWYQEHKKNNSLEGKISKKGGMYQIYKPLISYFNEIDFEYFGVFNGKPCLGINGRTEKFIYEIYLERTRDNYLIVHAKRKYNWRDESSIENRDWVFNESEDKASQLYIFQRLKMDFIK